MKVKNGTLFREGVCGKKNLREWLRPCLRLVYETKPFCTVNFIHGEHTMVTATKHGTLNIFDISANKFGIEKVSARIQRDEGRSIGIAITQFYGFSKTRDKRGADALDALFKSAGIISPRRPTATQVYVSFKDTEKAMKALGWKQAVQNKIAPILKMGLSHELPKVQGDYKRETQQLNAAIFSEVISTALTSIARRPAFRVEGMESAHTAG